MKKILSVSVALYNLENLILQNLESFVNSNFRDKLEIIVTDDGSKDNSVSIVEKYKKEYPECINLIKQENAGPGSTVNSGIKHATGKYFMMVDGDDWVNTNNLDLLIRDIEKIDVDMIITNYCEYSEQSKKIERLVSFENNIQANKIIKFDDKANRLSLSMHALIYNTKLFQENKLILDNCFYTDVEYVLLPIPYVDTCYYFNKDIYVYRVGRVGQSVNMSSMIKNISMHDLVFKRMLDYFEKNKARLKENIKYFFSNRLVEMAWTEIVVFLYQTSNEQKKNDIKKFIDYIKLKSEFVYKQLNKNKKIKLLKYSNYSIIPLFSAIIKKKYNFKRR